MLITVSIFNLRARTVLFGEPFRDEQDANDQNNQAQHDRPGHRPGKIVGPPDSESFLDKQRRVIRIEVKDPKFPKTVFIPIDNPAA